MKLIDISSERFFEEGNTTLDLSFSGIQNCLYCSYEFAVPVFTNLITIPEIIRVRNRMKFHWEGIYSNS